MFGRNRNKPDRFTSTPIYAPGDMYTSRRRRDDDDDDEEVGADGDLDALLEQEIRRYEELFVPGSSSPGGGGPDGADDDTLMDGSIYTSSPTMASAPNSNSSSIQPRQNHQLPYQQQQQTSSIYDPQEPEDESLWGLPNSVVPRAMIQPASTTLLTSRERAAANACAIVKPSASTKQRSNALTILSVEKKSESTSTPVNTKKPAAAAPAKTMKKSLSSRWFGSTKANTNKNANGTNKQASSSKNQPRAVPFTPASRQPPTSTPKTQASTPAAPPATAAAPKMKFFSPSKLFQKNSSKSNNASSKPVHPNLFTASFQKNTTQKAPPAAAAPEPAPVTPAAVPPHQRCRPPSPPPPMDHCDIISIGSAQSSLTEMDAWMVQHVSSTSTPPPKVIGGEHLRTLACGFVTEDYDDGLSPSRLNDDDDDMEKEEEGPRVHIEFDQENLARDSSVRDATTNEPQEDDDEESVAVSPLRKSEVPVAQDTDTANDEAAAALIKDLVSIVCAADDGDKEERPVILQEEEADSAVTTNDEDVQVVKILGLEQQQEVSSPTNTDVKRNLFGNNEEDEEKNESAKQEQEAVAEEKEEVKVAETTDVAKKPRNPILSPEIAVTATKSTHKPSKLKRFFKKFSSKSSSTSAPPANKNKQQQQEAPVERERVAKAAEAEVERLGLENETKQKEEQQQQKLKEEQGSHQSQSATSETGLTSGSSGHLEECPSKPRSFSLLSGSMNEPEALPVVTELADSDQPEKMAANDNACALCQRADHLRTHIVIPCMHYVLCDACVEESRDASAGCHCPTCNKVGFLFARVGVLEGPDLQAKLLQLGGGAVAPSMPVVNQ